MTLAAPWFDPLDDGARAALAGALVAYRRNAFARKLLAFGDPECAARFGDDAEAVLDGVATLVDWSAAHHPLRDRADGWIAGFVLHRLVHAARDDRARAAAVRNLRSFLAGGELASAPVRADGWDLPLFESCLELGVDEEAPGAKGEPLLPLPATIAGAYQLLASVWPDAVAWIRAVTPAIIGLGRPAAPTMNRSETYEAGGPIFVAEVDDPFKHAESLIHESQHHRFRLWSMSATLTSASDHAHRYISPYRRDPRRLWGIHMGVHAFAAVNELRLRADAAGLADPRTLRAAQRSHLANLFAFRTIVELDGGDRAATEYVVGLARCLLAHHERIVSAADPADLAEFERAFEAHCARVSSPLPIANDDPSFRDCAATLRLAERAAAGHTLPRFQP